MPTSTELDGPAAGVPWWRNKLLFPTERRLGTIAAPTTIVAGGADHVVPPAATRRLVEQIPGAELVELDHAGHLLHVQHAGRLAEVIAGA